MTQHAIPVCMCLCIKSPDRGLPPRLSVKESACNAGDSGLIPGSERAPGERNGNLLQYSCPENSMDRGARWTTVPGVAQSQT